MLEAPEKNKQSKKYESEIQELDLNIGDSIYTIRSGTRRRILEKVSDDRYPGGGYFRVEVTKKDGEKKEDVLLLPKLLEANNEGLIRIERLKEIPKIFNEKGDLLADVGDTIISSKGTKSKILSIERDLLNPEKSTVVVEVRKKDGTSSEPQVYYFGELKEAEKAGIISKIQKEYTGS